MNIEGLKNKFIWTENKSLSILKLANTKIITKQYEEANFFQFLMYKTFFQIWEKSSI